MTWIMHRWRHLWRHPFRCVTPVRGQYRETWFLYRLDTIVTISTEGPQQYRIVQQRCTWRMLFGAVEEYLCAPLEGENACRWKEEADLIPVGEEN